MGHVYTLGDFVGGSSPKHFDNLSTLRCVLVQYERLHFDKWQDSTVRFEYANKIQWMWSEKKKTNKLIMTFSNLAIKSPKHGLNRL